MGNPPGLGPGDSRFESEQPDAGFLLACRGARPTDPACSPPRTRRQSYRPRAERRGGRTTGAGHGGRAQLAYEPPPETDAALPVLGLVAQRQSTRLLSDATRVRLLPGPLGSHPLRGSMETSTEGRRLCTP